MHDISTRSRLFASVLTFALLLMAPLASAQTVGTEPIGSTVGMQGGKYGLGLTSSYPAYGLSGTLQLSEKITAEALLGFFGTVANLGARGWYRFKRHEKFDLYGYGAVGMYRYDYDIDTETVFGIGGGAGLEWSLQKVLGDDSLPPVFFNIDVGMAFASFEHYGGFSTLGFGGGAHYRFGR